jgi:hypothetical protein
LKLTGKCPKYFIYGGYLRLHCGYRLKTDKCFSQKLNIIKESRREIQAFRPFQKASGQKDILNFYITKHKTPESLAQEI